VVTLNTFLSQSVHLPNWPANAPHSITIVGYDDTAGTYTYVDTCGPHCSGGGTAGSVYTVSQSTMYSLIHSHPEGIVW
jgi:hypothetical protein